MAGHGRGRRLSGFALPAGPDVRGTLSSRLGCVLVSLGLLGPAPRSVQGQVLGLLALPVILAMAYLTGHPQEWFLLVIALSVWVGADVVRSGRPRQGSDGWPRRRHLCAGRVSWESA